MHATAKLKKIIANRKLRNRLFSPNLFADPAWDMILDLAVAMAEGHRISISSLCVAANVPPTTALRHIKAMTKRGLLTIFADAYDGRRKYVRLSAEMQITVREFADSID